MGNRGLVPRNGLRLTAALEPVTRSRAQLVLDVLPLAIMSAAAVAAAVAHSATGLLPLLSLGPAFAAVSSGLRKTTVIGIIALALCALIAWSHPATGLGPESFDFATVVGVTAAAVIASTIRQRRERELAEIRAIAEMAQRVLLGPVPSRLGPVQLAVRYVSAASRARIGGDLYEVVATPGGVRLIIGDVQGKGLSAVKTAATVLGTFREVAYEAADLETIADRIEISLARQLTDEQFVTAVLAQVRDDGSKIDLLNCGHPAPLLASGGVAQFVPPADRNLPLGLAHLADEHRDQTTVTFGPGDQMLFYTDGVSEARNKAGTFFPLTLSPSGSGDLDPDDVLDQLTGDVARHVGHALDDDAAMLLVRHGGEPRRLPQPVTATPGMRTG
jgi:serine phosphatase RsbU (regulator of sigma subunit)